jgi:MFS family permease
MHKNIKLLAWFNFFTDFSFFSPIAIIYYSKVSGSFALGMSIFSVVMVSSAIFELPTGVFSDYLGRRKTMVLGAISAALAVIFYALGFSYIWLFVGALLEGLSRSFFSGNNDALLYDTLRETGSEKEYHDFLGKTSSLFQFGSAVAALIGSIIAQFSFPLAIWLTFIPKLASIYIALFVVEPKSFKKSVSNIFSHLNESFKHFVHNKKLRLVSISHIYSWALSESGFQFRSAFVNTVWPVWAIGIALVLSNIGATISFYFSGKVIRRFGELRTLMVGSVYGKIINIISLVFPSVYSPALMTTSSVFFGTGTVAQSSLLQKEFTHKQRATMGSLNSFASSLAFGVVSVLLGLVADKIGPAKALLVTTIAGIPTIFIYLKLFKDSKN